MAACFWRKDGLGAGSAFVVVDEREVLEGFEISSSEPSAAVEYDVRRVGAARVRVW